jgi:hypothetical protein
VAGIFIALAGVGACVYFYQRFLSNKGVKKISPSAPSTTTSSTSQTTTQVTTTTTSTTNSLTVTTPTKPKEPQRPYKELLPMRDYPDVGKAALQFVKELDFSPVKDKTMIFNLQYQPTTPDISLLKALLEEVYMPKLLETAKSHKDQPISNRDGTKSDNYTLKWQDKEMVEVADICIKLSYAISCLTLEDLKPFAEKLQQKATSKIFCSYLVRQYGTYQMYTYFMCPDMYKLVRRGSGIGKAIDDKPEDFYSREDLGDESIGDESYFQLFFTEGAIQQTWNELYNDFCERVLMYVIEDDLKKADDRWVKPIVKDTSPKTPPWAL